jgi:hypothetical protein
MCIKFCFNLGRTTAEIYEKLKFSFGEEIMSSPRTFDWFFQAERAATSVNKAEC